MAATDCFVGVLEPDATSDVGVGRAGVDAGVTLSGSADEGIVPSSFNCLQAKEPALCKHCHETGFVLN